MKPFEKEFLKRMGQLREETLVDEALQQTARLSPELRSPMLRNFLISTIPARQIMLIVAAHYFATCLDICTELNITDSKPYADFVRDDLASRMHKYCAHIAQETKLSVKDVAQAALNKAGTDIAATMYTKADSLRREFEEANETKSGVIASGKKPKLYS